MPASPTFLQLAILLFLTISPPLVSADYAAISDTNTLNHARSPGIEIMVGGEKLLLEEVSCPAWEVNITPGRDSFSSVGTTAHKTAQHSKVCAAVVHDRGVVLESRPLPAQPFSHPGLASPVAPHLHDSLKVTCLITFTIMQKPTSTHGLRQRFR